MPVKIKITQTAVVLTIIVITIIGFAIPGWIYYLQLPEGTTQFDSPNVNWIAYSSMVFIALCLIGGFGLIILIGCLLTGEIKLFNNFEIALWKTKIEKEEIRLKKESIERYTKTLICLKHAKAQEEHDDIKYYETMREEHRKSAINNGVKNAEIIDLETKYLQNDYHP